jgi:hypothetical protein
MVGRLNGLLKGMCLDSERVENKYKECGSKCDDACRAKGDEAVDPMEAESRSPPVYF